MVQIQYYQRGAAYAAEKAREAYNDRLWNRAVYFQRMAHRCGMLARMMAGMS